MALRNIINKNTMHMENFDTHNQLRIVENSNTITHKINELTGEKEAVQKNLSFWSFPSILVIDIKRFNASNRKNQVLVTFPLEELNLSEYVI